MRSPLRPRATTGFSGLAVLVPVLGGRSLLVVLAAASTLVTVAIFASLVRRSSLSVPRRRERRGRWTAPGVRRDPAEALALVGDALAATHNPRALLPVILEVVTEATGARGGRIVEGGSDITWTGDVGRGRSPLTLQLATDGGGTELVLYPGDDGFSDSTRELAKWLAAQAAIALENARLHQSVQRQAITDDLTGLVNRRRFLEALDAEIARANTFGTRLAVVLADIDHFKLVNDRFGHQAGDDALRAFAALIRRHLRHVDVPGRLGGEEFAILLPDADADGAEAAAERMRRSLEEAALPTPERIRMTASFGVAELRAGEAGEELMRRADRALYDAKGSGRNRVATDAAVTPSDAR